MPFDPATAFTPISTMALFDLLLLVKANSPMRTLKDALDIARADPAKFNVGTINPGSTQNVTAELLRSTTGIAMTIVPASHLGRGAHLAAARRHPDRRGFLCGAEIADRCQADPRHRRKRQQAVADAAERADAAGKRRRCRGRRLEFAGRAGRHAEDIVDSAQRPCPRHHRRAPTFSGGCSTLAASPIAGSPEELDARLKSDIDMWAGGGQEGRT